MLCWLWDAVSLGTAYDVSRDETYEAVDTDKEGYGLGHADAPQSTP